MSRNKRQSSSSTTTTNNDIDEELKTLQTVRVSLKGVSVMLEALSRDMNGVEQSLDKLTTQNQNWAKLFGDQTTI